MSAVLYAECKIYFSGPPAKWLVNVKILQAIKRVSEANLLATCMFYPILAVVHFVLKLYSMCLVFFNHTVFLPRLSL